MKRQSKSYLIFSSAHLGISKDLLSLYRQVANFYKPEVIHLGPIVTEKERNKFLSNETKIERLSSKDSESALNALDALHAEQKEIIESQNSRIKMLTEAFGNVEFVLNEEQFIKTKLNNKLAKFTINGGKELTKYLFLSPILPSSERATHDPFTERAMEYLRQFGQSCIVAHPVPSVKSMPRIGLNEAYNYWSVGSLRHQEDPKKTRDQYLVGHLPCAMLVLVDIKNNEFHPKPLHVDYLERGHHTKKKPIIIDDGMVFFENKTISVKSFDKATYITDQHSKYWQPGVLAAYRKLNEVHEPEVIIDGGDTADMGGSNRHAENYPGEMLGQYVRNDIINLKHLLRAMDNVKSIKKRVMIDSNHHEWLSLRCAKDPALIGLLDWPTLAKEIFHKWHIIIRRAGENEIFWFGDYMIRHGDGESGAANGSKLAALGKYLCGHLHSFKMFRRAIQLGCGCMLGPKYIGGKVTSWQNMIASLTKYNGITAVIPKTVLHDKTKKVSRFAYGNDIFEVEDYKEVVNLDEPIYARCD